jgi:hypothetical protein
MTVDPEIWQRIEQQTGKPNEHAHRSDPSHQRADGLTDQGV